MIFTQALPDLLESIPASVYCKGRKGEYLEVNKLFLYSSEATRESEALGKTDRDLLWGEQADLLMRNDQEVMAAGKAKIVVEPCRSPRTVEHHIEKIKDKYGVCSKTDLIDMFFDSDI